MRSFFCVLLASRLSSCVADSPPATQDRLLLGITHGQTKRANLAQVAADGIRHINEYVSWGGIEPTAGTYDFKDLDRFVQDAARNGLTLALEIELTSELADDPAMSDQEYILDYLPDGLTFDRATSVFDDPNYVQRLAALVTTIMARYDSRTLTYVYVGNETDTYMRTVKAANGRNLFPGFQRLIEAIQKQVRTLPKPRPKFGTIFTFLGLGSSDYHEPHRQIAKVVEVMGFTVYPTVPGLAEPGTVLERTERFLDHVRAIAGTTPIAVTEIGHPAVPPPEDASPEEQAKFARFVIDYFRRHRSAFEYMSWFSIYDNPNFASEFFGGAGLLTIDGMKRPAYDLWSKQP